MRAQRLAPGLDCYGELADDDCECIEECCEPDRHGLLLLLFSLLVARLVQLDPLHLLAGSRSNSARPKLVQERASLRYSVSLLCIRCIRLCRCSCFLVRIARGRCGEEPAIRQSRLKKTGQNSKARLYIQSNAANQNMCISIAVLSFPKEIPASVRPRVTHLTALLLLEP